MDWDQILVAFEAHQRAQNRATRTIQGRRQMLTALARQTGKGPNEITKLDLIARMARGIAPASMQRERSDLRAFFGWAKKEGYIKKDPAKGLEKVTVPRGKPRPLTMDQVNAMLTSGAYRRTRIMITLGLYQGLRAHEIAKIRGEDFDILSNTLFVKGKGGKEAILPLHPLVAMLVPTMPAGYWFPARGTNAGQHIHYRSVSDLMTRAIRRAGITDKRLTGHSLRHTYGTELVEGGIDIRVVKEMMRHESLNSTQIYTGVSMKLMRESHAVMPIVRLPDHSGRLAA
jgi:integrase/recombinase XerD